MPLHPDSHKPHVVLVCALSIDLLKPYLHILHDSCNGSGIFPSLLPFKDDPRMLTGCPLERNINPSTARLDKRRVSVCSSSGGIIGADDMVGNDVVWL